MVFLDLSKLILLLRKFFFDFLLLKSVKRLEEFGKVKIAIISLTCVFISR